MPVKLIDMCAPGAGVLSTWGVAGVAAAAAAPALPRAPAAPAPPVARLRGGALACTQPHSMQPASSPSVTASWCEGVVKLELVLHHGCETP